MMKNPKDPHYVAFETALAEYKESHARLMVSFAETETKKSALLPAFGEVIIQFVKDHGKFYEYSAGMKRVRRINKKWYRAMECKNVASHDGFEDLVNAAFGPIEWEELYHPALKTLDHKKASFLEGMGDCVVVIREELTTSEMESILRLRSGTTT